MCRYGQIRFALTFFPLSWVKARLPHPGNLHLEALRRLDLQWECHEYTAYLSYEVYWPRKSLQLKKELPALLEGFINSFVITVASQSPKYPAQSPSDCVVSWKTVLLNDETLFNFFSPYIIMCLKQHVGSCWAFIYHCELVSTGVV